jgi:hypothetical protein
MKIIWFLLFTIGSHLFAECYSDYDCDFKSRCFKNDSKKMGECVKKTTGSKSGFIEYKEATVENIGPYIDIGSECVNEMDCPANYHCDREYRVCIRR